MRLLAQWGARPLRWMLGLWLAWMAVWGGVAWAHATAEKPVLRFGVFAYLRVQETRRQYEPLVQHLNATLPNHRVELLVLPQEDINAAIAARELDFVTTNPTHFLVIRNRYPLTGVIATRVTSVNGRAVHQLGGVIITRGDHAAIRTLADVRGHTLAAPSLQHMGGYRAQAFELHQAGVQLPQDVARIDELGTHQAVVEAVLAGRVDVGLVREGVLELMLERGQLQPGQVRIINPIRHPHFPFVVSTRLYPEWPVFALPHVADRTVRQFASALFALEPESPTAVAAGLHGYTVSADYLPVEALARTLRLPPFDRNVDVTWADIWEKWRLQISVAAVALLLILGLAAVVAVLARRERLARARLRLLLQTLGEGVLGTDRNGRCSFVNPAAVAMLGGDEAQVLGQPQIGLLQPMPAAEPRSAPAGPSDPLQQTLQDGVTRRGEAWVLGTAGSGFPVDYVVSPVRQGAETVGAVLAFQNISQRKADEQNLRRLVAELTQSNADLKEARHQLLQSEKLASIGQLAAGVAHEINNPVAFVSSNLSTLEGYVGQLLGLAEVAYQNPALRAQAPAVDLPFVQEDVLALLRESKDGLQRVRKIVLDLRNFSRADAVVWEQASVNACIDAALNIVWNELKYHCTVHKHYADLPPVRCIPSQLGQVFINLLLNAAQAIEGQGNIHITTEPVGLHAVRVRVRDSGRGIAPEHLGRVFDPFFTTKPPGKGTGLGLALVWGIVERHRARITVESQPGQGATFFLTLPIAGGTELPKGEEAAEAAATTAETVKPGADPA